MIIYLISLFVFSFLFRSLVRIKYPKLIDFDTYFHLFLIRYIRENGIGNMVEKKRFIKPFSINYPWMVHWILKNFSQKYDNYVERFFNPFLDASFVIFLYLLTYYLTNSNELSFNLSLLYIFTPATFSILGVGPRIKSFTPRLFGEIVGSLVLIFEYLYLESGNTLFLFTSIILGTLIFLSSKFALQSIIFINIPLILFSQCYELISVLIFGFIISMILSKGKYLYIFKEQIYHLSWYFRENIKGKMAVSDRNNFKELLSSIISFKIKKIVTILLFKNSYSILIYKMPVVILYIYLLFKQENITNLDLIVISGLIVFIISSLKWFLFIGEAERYLNYVLFFILFSIVTGFNNYIVLYGLILYGMIYYLLDFIHLLNNKNNKTEDNDIVINWLNDNKQILNIATIPYHLGNGWRNVYDTKHNWLFANLWIDKKEKIFFDNNYMYKYPILDIRKVKDIIEKYELDYVIYDKRVINNNFVNFKLPDNLKEKKISDNIYAIYK